MALLIKSDGTQLEITPNGPDGTLSYEQVREAIGGGWVERIETDPKLADGYEVMYMDEEGKLKGLPFNKWATMRSAYTSMCDGLCGDVVLCVLKEDMP